MPTRVPLVAVRVGKVVRIDLWGQVFSLYNGEGRCVNELTLEQARQLSTELARMTR
jgi:hypothetical protein